MLCTVAQESFSQHASQCFLAAFWQHPGGQAASNTTESWPSPAPKALRHAASTTTSKAAVCSSAARQAAVNNHSVGLDHFQLIVFLTTIVAHLRGSGQTMGCVVPTD